MSWTMMASTMVYETPICSGHLQARSGAQILLQQPFRRRTFVQRCAQLRVSAVGTLEAVLADEEDEIIIKPQVNLKGRSRSRRFRDMASKVPGRTVELGALIVSGRAFPHPHPPPPVAHPGLSSRPLTAKYPLRCSAVGGSAIGAVDGIR